MLISLNFVPDITCSAYCFQKLQFCYVSKLFMLSFCSYSLSLFMHSFKKVSDSASIRLEAGSTEFKTQVCHHKTKALYVSDIYINSIARGSNSMSNKTHCHCQGEPYIYKSGATWQYATWQL